MTAPTLQEQLDAAIAARQRILVSGQEMGRGDRRLQLAELTALNKTIASLQAQLARAAGNAAGRPSSLGFASVEFDP